MTAFDTHFLRPYRGNNDLSKMLQFVGECNVQTDFCGYLHPGDVCHFISNTLRGQDIEMHCFLYESSEDHLLAFLLLYPVRFNAYEVLVHPDYRGSELETALVSWSEQKVRSMGSDKAWIESDVMDCDTIRQDVLRKQGYLAANEPFLFYTMRPLQEAVPEVSLPEGFAIRNVAGEHEADALGTVHASAFGSSWQPGEYLKAMRSPGFHIDHELVVVAPDQCLVAFLIYWIDPISQSGLFEPVGCHKDFRRRGLTKALMYEGMRRMMAHGMTRAIVMHEAHKENPASAVLYHSVGFTMKHTITVFRKRAK